MRAFFELHVRVKSSLKTFLNFCVLQVLTKELISANRGDGQQNSLAEHIMQKFIEVFHCLCLLQAIFKLLHFTLLSVIVSDVSFFRTFHRCYVFVRFLSVACFPAHPSSFIFSAPFTHLVSRFPLCDAFSRALQRLHLVLAVDPLQCVFPRFQSVTHFPALASPQYSSDCCHAVTLSRCRLCYSFLQALLFLLQILDSNDSQRLLDGMFDKTALSCSLLRLLRSRQVHWVYLAEAVILFVTIRCIFLIVDLQMALQRKGIDCGFVNTISKLPSHHVKGASVLLAILAQKLSQL